MTQVRVTKIFRFEMAHALDGHDGDCKNIHGHSYKLHVTIRGSVLHDDKDPKNGMVMDFGELKRIVKAEIVDRFDHALMVNRLVPESQLELLKKTTDRIIIVDFQPTSENFAAYIAEILQKHLPAGVNLFSIRLFETVTAFAEWFASDNQ